MTTPLIPCQSPSTRAEAESAFRSYAARTRDDATEGHDIISWSNEARILSLWGAACDALRVGPGDDVIPLLPDLWRLKAGLDAEDGLARRVPDDAPGCARRVLRTVYCYHGDNRQLGRDGGSLVPASLQGLLRYDDGSEAQPEAHLAVFGRVVRHVVPEMDAPRELPDVRQLYAAADTLPSPVKPGTIRAAASCYRRLRAKAVAADPANAEQFAVLADPRRTQGRGLLKALSESKDPSDRAFGQAGDLENALKAKAPLLHAQMKEFAADPRGMKGKLLSVEYVEEMWNAASGIAAILYEYRPTALPAFEVDQLWTCMVEMTPEVAGVDARNAKYLPAGAGTVSVLLARWLADRMAEKSRCLTGASSGYPASVTGDVTQWWTLTERFHGNAIRTINPAVWTDWKRQYDALRDHIRANPVPADEVAQKASLERMLLVSLPILWCVALPLLGREAERLLDRFEALRRAAVNAGHTDPLMVPNVARARTEFEERAEGYLAVLLPWIDTMRRAQYLHGRYGLHFVPGYNEHGRLIALHCNWAGKRLDRARVKQGTLGHRAYGPGLINLRVFMGYIEHVRAPRLVKLGAAPNEAVAPNGRWPLFVGPDATSLDDCAMSESTLRVLRYGATLYRITTEILGHDLEPYESMDRAKRWKGAWAMHEVRKDAATIIGELMGRWDRACAMTMDAVEVLKKRYLVPGFHIVGEPGEWQCVETYLPYVCALLENPRRAPCPLDDPDLPLPPGARAMLERWAEEDAKRGRRARRSKHGVADAHLRRPRPDVAERNRQRASTTS